MTMKKKIAHFCEFADQRCGVFRAVLELAKRQQESEQQEVGQQQEKASEVIIYSTHFMKDYSISNQNLEKIEGVTCIRIPAKKVGGEAFNKWEIKSKRFAFYDELWSHGYRKHPNIFLSKHKTKKVLVTHAPWGSSSLFRSLTTGLFDQKYSKRIKEAFKIYHIAKWEKEETIFPENFKIIKLPLRKEFKETKPTVKRKNKVLFVGNIKKIQPFIDYAPKTKITIVTDCFNIKKLIKLYDSHKYFLAISEREGLPTTLREAKARGCITIATRNKGTLEVGADYFFNYGDWEGINELIESKKIK